MELTLKNKNLITMARFLRDMPLTGTDSRERVKFIEACAPYIDALEARRLAMAEEYAEKDENNLPVIMEGGGGSEYELTDENQEKFKKEFNDLMDAEWSMSVEDGNLTKLRTVKLLVTGTDQKFAGQQAFEHAAWCEALDKLEF